jgi:hypothetical protein
MNVNPDFVAEVAFLKLQRSDLSISTSPKQIPSSIGAAQTAHAQSGQIQFFARVPDSCRLPHRAAPAGLGKIFWMDADL